MFPETRFNSETKEVETGEVGEKRRVVRRGKENTSRLDKFGLPGKDGLRKETPVDEGR